MEKFGGAGVHEEVKFEAKTEQDVGGVLVGGDARITECAEQDGVKFIAEHFDGTLWERNVFAEKFVGAPVEFDEIDVAAMLGGGGFDGGNGSRSNFLADAVAGDDGDTSAGTAMAQSSVGHRMTPRVGLEYGIR